MNYNIITVAFGVLRKVTSLPINYKYDIGQILRITGLDLPESYVVDFCNEGDATTISMVGTADGVQIPDEFLQTGKPVKAYVVLSGEDNTQTRYEITIPVNARPARTDIQPTPEEQSTIDRLIAAMNTAVEESEANADRAGDAADRSETAVSHYPKIEAGNWYVWNPETGAYEDTGIQAEGEDGVGIQSATLNADFTLTLTFTDGTSYTTPSIRGEPGQPGQNGVSPTITVTAITGGHRVEITDTDGTKTFNVMDGQTGATPDIQIGTVTTLPAGSEATAEITGTPEQPRLNLGIPEGQKGDPGEVTQAQLDTALANKADIITDTASGAIASFPDGADDMPIKQIVASIEPQQDLHGQDAPYPPGGGVNKANLTGATSLPAYNLTTSFDTENEIITISGTVVNATNTYVQYRFATFPNIQNGLGLKAFNIPASASVYVDNLYWDGSTQQMVIVIRGLTAGETNTLNVKFQMVCYEGSTAPSSWTPYSNECPISGWTGMQGQRTGKNLLSFLGVASRTNHGVTYTANSDGSISIQDTASGTSFGFESNSVFLHAGDYVLHTENMENVRTVLTNSAGTISNVYVDGNGSKSFTLATDDTIKVYPRVSSGVNPNVTNGHIQLEPGSTASAYSAYTGTTKAITWQDEAGTVYGGNVTISEDGGCVLMVDRAIVDLGTLNWNVSDRRFNALTTISNAKGGNHADCLCSIYKSDVGAATRTVDCSICFANNGYVYIYDTTFSGDASAFKTAMSGVKLVYKLATPITYTLPDVTMLSTLLGTNNIWVDTGDVSAEYRADTKLYIDKKLAALVAALS